MPIRSSLVSQRATYTSSVKPDDRRGLKRVRAAGITTDFYGEKRIVGTKQAAPLVGPMAGVWAAGGVDRALERTKVDCPVTSNA